MKSGIRAEEDGRFGRSAETSENQGVKATTRGRVSGFRNPLKMDVFFLIERHMGQAPSPLCL